MKRYNLVHLVALLAVLFASVGQVQAVVLGPFSGTWDGTEPLSNGRLFRDGIQSDGITQKPWPGVFNGGSFYKYEVFQFYNNGPADVVTVNGTFTEDDFGSFLSAFRGTVFLNDLASNEPNYLGDIGLSISQPFSFLAPANTPFFVLANATDSEASPNSSTVSFTVSGNFVSTPSAVPEPTSMEIFGLGALGIAYRARRRSKCKA
jgi:hypothetical protein